MHRSFLHLLPFAFVMNWTYEHMKDPCSSAVQLFEPNGRFRNCKYASGDKLCDRYIHKRWYRFSTNMLTQCPELLSCGALYPIWLNGTLPTSMGRLVNRKACKIGFDNCCVKQYDIQIKHCGTYMAYCLVPADGCPERYCFGENGTCEPTSTTDIHDESMNQSTLQTRNGVSITTTTILSSTSLYTENPCETALPDNQCRYELGNICHEDLHQGWYSSSFPALTTCPTKPICNSFYLHWINGYKGECKDNKQENDTESGKTLAIALPSTGVLALIIIGTICYIRRKTVKEKREAEPERQYAHIDNIQDNGTRIYTELSSTQENISCPQHENTGYESHRIEEEAHIYDSVTTSQPIQNTYEQIS